MHALIGDLSTVPGVAIKTMSLFLTAAAVFRFTERRTLAQFAPFDWIAAVAAGAIVGRAATATDASWLSASTALVCLLVTHAALARLRFVPRLRRFIDPPPTVLIRSGKINVRNLRRCGLTEADLQAASVNTDSEAPTRSTSRSSRPRAPSRCWPPTTNASIEATYSTAP
jgi:uncharacterized membrane protein YcaP (DUF421 family)